MKRMKVIFAAFLGLIVLGSACLPEAYAAPAKKSQAAKKKKKKAKQKKSKKKAAKPQAQD